MTKPRLVVFSCACALLTASVISAASVSLDNAGADPTLNGPTFSFQTDETGGFFGTFTNLSNQDFTRLDFTAQFTKTFYQSAKGPANVLNACSGGIYFNTCGFTRNDTAFTLAFFFFGNDSSHAGVPIGTSFPTSALVFDQFQTIDGNANLTSAPEPGAFGLAAIGLALCGLVVSRKQFLKTSVRP